jgi:hypothetical protein
LTGGCIWRWNGSFWAQDSNTCPESCACPPPSTPGAAVDEQAGTTCGEPGGLNFLQPEPVELNDSDVCSKGCYFVYNDMFEEWFPETDCPEVCYCPKPSHIPSEGEPTRILVECFLKSRV